MFKDFLEETGFYLKIIVIVLLSVPLATFIISFAVALILAIIGVLVFLSIPYLTYALLYFITVSIFYKKEDIKKINFINVTKKGEQNG